MKNNSTLLVLQIHKIFLQPEIYDKSREMRQTKARIRRLSLWFSINLIIFVLCYLNYLFQLKHRYLYKTLNVGLCFSRAAAMVINFNLLLVWLPMCKYSLTRLAFLGSNSLRHYRQNHTQLVSSMRSVDTNIHKSNIWERSLIKFKISISDSVSTLQLHLLEFKINSMNSFLIAVDHCKSLHTICATTITIAAVIHTIAHLINVINFSKNFNPLLNNLNMAEYKGQNPLQLLISVPGITGVLMIIILILMSLSSVDFIRNSSYDLFQIFHRLSIIFVVLLFLHPSSHVLKEQSNVDRHHPEFCLSEFKNIEAANISNNSMIFNASAKAALNDENSLYNSTLNNTRQSNSNEKDSIDGKLSLRNSSSLIVLAGTHDLDLLIENKLDSKTSPAILDSHSMSSSNANGSVINSGSNVTEYLPSSNYKTKDIGSSEHCLDPLPLFVAQSSICWYVLSIGLSCYLVDLILRKWRRSKTSIQLLNARMDMEGNLIELILSNNHKRFSQWLPGQFVYLNCPQIATYEWHPFTISSMDNRNKQFTLHIKTGGDWTRKLRHTLESLQNNNSMSLQGSRKQNQEPLFGCKKLIKSNNLVQLDVPVLPDFECYNNKTGELQIECTKLIRFLKDNNDFILHSSHGNEQKCYRINLEDNQQQQQYQQLYSICSYNSSGKSGSICKPTHEGLSLYIDGPFHSPFERLLEQQVSVCIANGVGWTAFSSVFQCILNNLFHRLNYQSKDWWNKWRNFAISSYNNDAFDFSQNNQTFFDTTKKIVKTRLHLMVIVTSIEQFEPFYNLANDYFKKIQRDQISPVKEITAFITRSNNHDKEVKDFCLRENLSYENQKHSIRVNNVFNIYFGKPNFDFYLNSFCTIYPNSSKISVYCCGSYQVKKTVQELCRNFNKTAERIKDRNWPIYSYHEENF